MRLTGAAFWRRKRVFRLEVRVSCFRNPLSSEKPLKAGVSDRLAATIPVTLGSESKFGWRPEGLGNFSSACNGK